MESELIKNDNLSFSPELIDRYVNINNTITQQTLWRIVLTFNFYIDRYNTDMIDAQRHNRPRRDEFEDGIRKKQYNENNNKKENNIKIFRRKKLNCIALLIKCLSSFPVSALGKASFRCPKPKDWKCYYRYYAQFSIDGNYQLLTFSDLHILDKSLNIPTLVRQNMKSFDSCNIRPAPNTIPTDRSERLDFAFCKYIAEKIAKKKISIIP